MKDRLWFKGAGKVTEPGLVAFIRLWDASSVPERVEFLKKWTPHLYDWEVREYSRRQANQLGRGVLIGLVMLFESEEKPQLNDEGK